ncbi:MAG: DNA alkylation repair protein, partial [bacterium]
MDDAVREIGEGLRALADPAKAGPMEKYMKHRQPFLGVQAPRVIQLARRAARRFPPADLAQFERIVRELWRGEYREERYAAMRMAALWPQASMAAALPLYEWMIVSAGWWDLVDFVAAQLVGRLIRARPELKARVYRWIDSDQLWLRRTALI